MLDLDLVFCLDVGLVNLFSLISEVPWILLVLWFFGYIDLIYGNQLLFYDMKNQSQSQFKLHDSFRHLGAFRHLGV